MTHCPSKWGGCSPGTVFPGRASHGELVLWPPAKHLRDCTASSSCSPPRTGLDQPSEQSVSGKQRQNQDPNGVLLWGHSAQIPSSSYISKHQCPQKVRFNHLVKDTNSTSPANAKYCAESHPTDSGEKRQKAAFFMIPFWAHCIISGLYIKTDVSLISQSQRNHSFLVLWRMFLQMNSFHFKQDPYLME